MEIKKLKINQLREVILKNNPEIKSIKKKNKPELISIIKNNNYDASYLKHNKTGFTLTKNINVVIEF